MSSLHNSDDYFFFLSHDPQVGGRPSAEDAGQLYDLVIRSQGDRLDEQRSELLTTQPDEDISEIVASMQKGRIDGQRASLDPRSDN